MAGIITLTIRVLESVDKGRGRRALSLFAAGLLFGCAAALSQEVPVVATSIPPANPENIVVNEPQSASSGSQAVGVIPQPTPAAPGLVTGITLGELYTDNLMLAPSGAPRESDWITQVEPFVKSAYASPRLSGVFNYSLTGYVYTQHHKDNQLSQNLATQGTLTVLPQHLFLDGIATYDQQTINNALPAGPGTFFLTNNVANAATGLLSPYWVQSLGGVGMATLRYSHGRVAYNTHGGIAGESEASLAGIPNITSNALQFGLDSPAGVTWGWNLGYSNQRIEPDFGRGVQFALAKAGTSLQVSPTTQLLADAGKENQFLPDGTVNYLGAGFWDAGFEWNSTLNSLRLLAGHRFFGRSFELSWTHIAALLTTNVSYAENPTDYNQQLLGQTPSVQVVAPTTAPNIASLTEFQPYLSKRLSASAVYTGAHSTLTLTLYDELRTFFVLDSSQQRVANAQLDWQFEVGAFTNFTPTVGWQRYQFQDGQISYDHFLQLALVHQFGLRDFGSVRVRSDSNNVYDPEPGAHGYRFNVIFVQWTRMF